MHRPGQSSQGLKVVAGFATVLVAVSLAAAPAQAAKCVNPGGTGGCFSTIQAAVDAASASETVSVRPGIYEELVTIPDTKPGLRLVGTGRKPGNVVVSGFRLDGTVILVLADNVQIRNLTVANGNGIGIHVAPGNPGALILGVSVRGCGGAGIQIDDSGEVRGSAVRACGQGILGSSPASLIARQNTIQDCSTGISLDGHDVLVTGNRVTTCPQSIAATADFRALVENNRVESALTHGINMNGATSGTVLTARGNVVESYGTGITASGFMVGVERNTVLATAVTGIGAVCEYAASSFVRNNKVTGGDLGISVLNQDAANGVEVSGNTVHGATGLGLLVKGNQNDIRRNLVASCGTGLFSTGIRVDGTQNTVAQNKALNNGGFGFEVRDQDNQLTGNTASGNVVGIEILEKNNVLLNNTTSGNSRYGISLIVGAGGTTVQNSTAVGNLAVDFCDAGGSTTLIGNRFGTTSTSCP